MDQPLRVVNVLGQKPGFTGSGVLVQELWKCGLARGDQHRLICAGYPGEDWSRQFGENHSLITFSTSEIPGELPFPIPGMSDAMPYDAVRYRDLSAEQVDRFIAAFRRELGRVAREFRPDLVHVHHLWALTRLAGEIDEVPVVVTVHGTDLKLARTAAVHRDLVVGSLPRIKHVFCVSSAMRDDACHEYKIRNDNISILYNGYNDKLFQVNGESAELPGKVVLCAGKFVEWKGFRYAIRASSQVAESHRLVILGTGPAEQRRVLEREAVAHGVDVLFPGHVPPTDVAKWMRRADVFVLPSIKEPFGLVLLEAMACGCRVVAADSGGPKDIIRRELALQGLASLVAALDERDGADQKRYVRDLADAIQLHLLRTTGPSERREVARSVSGMTWGAVYEQMRSTYQEIIGRVPMHPKHRRGV